MPPGNGQDLLLDVLALAGLAETAGDQDNGLHAFAGAVLHHGQGGPGRNRDNRQIHGRGHAGQIGINRQASARKGYGVAFRVDAIDIFPAQG